LGALLQADVLIATRLRDDLAPAEKSRGPIDKGRGALERIRYTTGHSEARMVPLEALQQAQGTLLCGGIARRRGWLWWVLLFGDPLLFERLFRPIPGPQLGSGLREGKLYGDGDFGGHQHEKDEALPPEIAPTVLITQFVELRERWG
jgi:hypothetical protein